RGHTRFKCDWSSDVCSSDLYGLPCCKVKYRGVDCGVKVDREIFCDSPIAKGMMCGRTKAQTLCANVLAPYSVAYKYIQITSKQTICPFQWQPVHQTKVRPIVLRYLYFEEGVQHALLDFYSDSNDTC